MEATKTEWVWVTEGKHIREKSGGFSVATARSETVARRIVRIVNAHDDLLAAVKRAREISPTAELTRIYDAAIAKAEQVRAATPSSSATRSTANRRCSMR